MSQSSRKVIANQTFEKAFIKKPVSIQKRIIRAIDLLVANPRHPSLQMHRIVGAEGVWEVYVDRTRYRMTLEFTEQGDILLLNNCTHSILPRR